MPVGEGVEGGDPYLSLCSSALAVRASDQSSADVTTSSPEAMRCHFCGWLEGGGEGLRRGDAGNMVAAWRSSMQSLRRMCFGWSSGCLGGELRVREVRWADRSSEVSWATREGLRTWVTR